MHNSTKPTSRTRLTTATQLTLAAVALLVTTAFARADGNGWHESPEVPASLQVPAGNPVYYHVAATGVQIYVWTLNPTNPALASWVFKAPEATLFNERGRAVGIHYAGPTWESKDGSKVVGARVAGATVDASAIPWLLLRAVSTEGPGILQHATYIQRVNTAGGLAPAIAGTGAGEEARVAYTADYYFYRFEPTRGVFGPDAHPYGATFEEWAAAWWQWTLAFPATANPANDSAPPDGDQSGKVWFLPTVQGNATVTRQLAMPEGTALFFPALSVFFNNADCPNPTALTEAELVAQANGTWDFAASVTACTIDGVSVVGLQNPKTSPYRLTTEGFPVTVASHDNLLAAAYGVPCFPDGGTVDPTVAVGTFLMVRPLAVGRHTLHIVGAAGPVDNPFFVKDITYEIRVVRRHGHGHKRGQDKEEDDKSEN
jgi:hypothetical protein